jgi:hypothetical protein
MGSIEIVKTGIRNAGFDDFTGVVMKGSVFWNTMPFSQGETQSPFRRNITPPFATMEMMVMSSSETSVDILRTARRYIPEAELSGVWNISQL